MLAYDACKVASRDAFWGSPFPRDSRRCILILTFRSIDARGSLYASRIVNIAAANANARIRGVKGSWRNTLSISSRALALGTVKRAINSDGWIPYGISVRHDIHNRTEKYRRALLIISLLAATRSSDSRVDADTFSRAGMQAAACANAEVALKSYRSLRIPSNTQQGPGKAHPSPI